MSTTARTVPESRSEPPAFTAPAARIAVVIPCLDEERTIAGVLADFRRELPEALLVVVDNASRDATAAVAARAGATVLREKRPGKGNAVRKAFRAIDADIYLLVDGDGTYPACDARRLIEPIVDDDADVVIGGRLQNAASEFRWVNRLGNRLFLWIVNLIFRARVSDLLTGFRAMSRAFVRQTPMLSTGFELETELTILALERGFRTIEVPIHLSSRPDGSHSKIRVFGDGVRILTAILTLLRDYRPLTFFGGAGLTAMLIGIAPGLFVTWEFMETGFVRVPTAVLAVGLEIVGMMLVVTGVLLATLARRFREIEHHFAGLAAEIRRAGQPEGPDLPRSG